MASLFERERKNVRILDPGAGAGVLLAACVDAVVSRRPESLGIEVVAYENDRHILPALRKTMERCERTCKEADIPFRGEIRAEDYIAAAIEQTDEHLFARKGELFTHGILNPPYKKINGKSATRRLLNLAGVEVSNLYAAFVWLTARMLRPGGELVAITPRSFCNGPYFRRFRLELLDMMSLRAIHVFESRKKAFGDDDVLQENIIYYAVREPHKPDHVRISSSEGVDFDIATKRSVPYEHVIFPGDPDAFVHIVVDSADDRVIDKMQAFATSLDELRLGVSTGRVVDFRAQEYLRILPDEGTVPLVNAHHFYEGFVRWPLESGKKPNAIVLVDRTSDLMAASGYYVLTKRFSAKEERRRVVAAVYDPHRIEAPLVGFENHLNYFHAKGKGLSENLAKGLALYLISSLFDRLFRLFSGHTQVNATDLRKMRYPSREQLTRLGAHVKHQMPQQDLIDIIVERECGSDG
ncbi:MAG: Eco57I restriction-modification methylase domain-containing protein [Desulfomonilaceae bacterium]